MANLKYGSTGDEVKKLQTALGFTGKDVDGIFGKKTQQAVINYQKANGLAVDGIAGKNTQGKLYAPVSNKGNTGSNAGSQKPAATGTGGAGANNNGKPKETFTTPAGNTYDSFTYDEFTYDPFQGSETLNQAWATLGQLNGNAPGSWTDPYAEQRKGYLDEYENRGPFNYDFNSDALYQQYKDQYIQQGQMAMMDTMGQAASMTGGYGNSYAQTVGQQAYNQQLNQLNAIMPELYDRAYGIYQQEGEELLRMYDLYTGLSNESYNQYLGDVDMYYKQLDAATNYAATLQDKEYGEWIDKTKMDFDTWSANTGLSFDEWAAKTGILSDENNTLMDQEFRAEEAQKDRNFQASQNAISRAETQKSNNKSDLINLIANGYTPTKKELAAAGLTPEQAAVYAKAAAPKESYIRYNKDLQETYETQFKKATTYAQLEDIWDRLVNGEGVDPNEATKRVVYWAAQNNIPLPEKQPNVGKTSAGGGGGTWYMTTK